MSTLAERLTEAMKGPPAVSQAELARVCGIKQPSVADWLSGRTKRMVGKNLLAASRRLNVNPDWLATGTGPMRLKTLEFISKREKEISELDELLRALPDNDFQRIKSVCQDLASYTIKNNIGNGNNE